MNAPEGNGQASSVSDSDTTYSGELYMAEKETKRTLDQQNSSEGERSDNAEGPSSQGQAPTSTSGNALNPKNIINSVIDSAVRHFQDIEKEPAVQSQGHGMMMTGAGLIRLQPDRNAVLNAGTHGADVRMLDDSLEAASGEKSLPHRAGLLSNYLRLMHLDRSTYQSGKKKGRNRETENNTPSDAWVDENTSSPEYQSGRDTSRQSGLRRRKGRSRYNIGRPWRPVARGHNNAPTPNTTDGNATTDNVLPTQGSGFFASVKKMKKSGSSASTTITPLANKGDMPFRHLSEALPWASSQRQFASASACGTPLIHTRRQSISSMAGDISTIPNMSVDNKDIAATAAGLRLPNSPMQADYPVGTSIERQNIMQAIDLLLLHQRFVVFVAKALMMYGSPLHHLEDNLTRVAHILDLEMTASAIPGLVILSFDDSVTHTSETKIIRCNNGWDMHRLDQTTQLLRRVVHNKIEVKAAVAELEGIMVAPPIYAWYWQVLNFGVLAWSLCLVCFGGSWVDSGISFALGIVAGLMNLAAGKLAGYTNFFEASVSVVSGLLSAAFSKWGCFGATSLSATAVLLPGLVMTTGVIELSSRHMLSGTVRVFYALLLAFIIAYGLLIGVEIYNKIAGNSVLEGAYLDLSECKSLTQWSWFGTFPVGIINISVLVNIHWRYWISVIVVAGISYSIFWLFKFHLGLDDLAPVVASFVLGLVANIWSKFTGQTAYMILLPGEMYMVPGSVGVRGFSSLLSKEGGQGAQLALQMITTCLSIMMGLFASTFVVYPRGKQHSALVTV
ncbi:pheromone-regulated protein prm10 [Coemansia sp. RSA 1813]|nr:pheromone-regulated protein prm10 [Coemansia sp. RSA 1843]KAJ2216134.1 pheromone-regulated protein prm10 [Coemansia sp. RSA 487]KAJ2570120.1 pheromone-regulated protein prm10 [Coemansia sp. RSA 1813]